MPDDTPLGPYGKLDGGTSGISGIAGPTSATGNSTTHTFEEMVFAGSRIADHPNLIGDRFKQDLRNGLTPQVGNHLLKVFYRDKNKGFYYPSLLNYLWYTLEGGFKIRIDGTGYVHRTVNFKPGARFSNHAYGAAVDIMAMGRGEAVPYTSNKYRSENDALWNMLSNLPRDTKPEETGSVFDYVYNGWFKVYKEENATHIHYGFGQNQVGSLIPALKAGGSTPAGIRNTSSTRPRSTGSSGTVRRT